MDQRDPWTPTPGGAHDASGVDRNDALRITLDGARAVLRAEVLAPERLRTPEAFDDALREAFGAADGNRVLALLEAEGRAEEQLARAEETLAGRSRPRVPTRPDVSRAAVARRRELREATGLGRTPAYPEPTTSDNGYLTVQRGRDGRLVGVVVDEEWLGGARPEHLENAIVQAMGSEGRDMGLKENRDALIAAAAGWDGVADEVSDAQMKLWTGNGMGTHFGFFATRAGIHTAHDTFITDMIDAMANGTAVLRDVAEALRGVATDFGATDVSVADDFHNLDGTPK